MRRWAVPSRGRLLVALGAAMILVLCLVPVAFSGFTAETGTGAGFQAGSVALGDDDADVTLFNVGSLQPGSSGSQCIALSYTGTLASQVKLYIRSGDVTGTGLAPYLTLNITEGSGGAFGSCSGFVAASSIYTGTLSNLAAVAGDHASGVGTFAPTGAGQVRVYRITYMLTKGAAAQGLTAQARLTWEARNT